jgi:2-C-methyl-D-erythritol 4-phosphate cytidylyltransferase
MPKKTIDTVIVAAGSGKRLGARTPKAFVALAGRPLFVHSLLRFARHKNISRIIIVAPPSMVGRMRRVCSLYLGGKKVTVVGGGVHRWQSVKNGVAASQADWVLIHDAARPFVTAAVIDAVISASKKYAAVIAATAEVDTVRKFRYDRAMETLDRNEIVRVQTPQLFVRKKLLKAFSHASRLSSPPTDEAVLMERAGTAVGIAPGDPLNFKITTKEDLALAEAWCSRNNQ